MHWRAWQSCSRLRIGRVLLILTICLSAGTTSPSHGDDPPQSQRVAILFGARESYRSAAASLEASLKAKGIKCVTAELPKKGDKVGREKALRSLTAAKPAVIATAGIGATSFVLDKVSKTPVVFFTVPNGYDAVFMKASSAFKNRIAGVTTDASPEEQLAWIARQRPTVRNIAILHSTRTKQTVRRFKAASRKQKITITAITSDKEKFPEVIEALNASGCDGVLMIPDAHVYNTATIRRLLLWGLRQKKPIWTFSANVVKAGALAGMYSDTDKAAQQTAELIGKILNGVKPEKIGLQYPRDARTAVNVRTAKMIEVNLDDKIVRLDTVKFGEEP